MGMFKETISNGRSVDSSRRHDKRIASSFGSFDDFDDFVSYTDVHYLPLLDKISEEGYEITRDDARLLRFLYDDLTTLVNNGLED